MRCELCEQLIGRVSDHLKREGAYDHASESDCENLLVYQLGELAGRLVNLAGMGVPPDPDKGPVVPGEKR